MPVRLSRRRPLAILGGAVALGTALGSLKVFELASHEVEQLRVEDELIRLPQPLIRSSFRIRISSQLLAKSFKSLAKGYESQ